MPDSPAGQDGRPQAEPIRRRILKPDIDVGARLFTFEYAEGQLALPVSITLPFYVVKEAAGLIAVHEAKSERAAVEGSGLTIVRPT